MVVGRRFDAQATALTKQGRLAVYPSSRGQEACEVGAVLALREQDWLFPTYRDSVAMVTRGVAPVEVLTLLRGDWHCGYDPHEHRVAPQCTPLATNTLHAVGLAHAARLKGEDTVALVHARRRRHQRGRHPRGAELRRGVEGAGRVLRAEQRVRDQRAAGQADRRAVAGPQGHRLRHARRNWSTATTPAAVYAAVSQAVERAAAGDGPTLIEALTYRIEAHTNADDATRYRDAGRGRRTWLARDPLARLEAYLRERRRARRRRAAADVADAGRAVRRRGPRPA